MLMFWDYIGTIVHIVNSRPSVHGTPKVYNKRAAFMFPNAFPSTYPENL